MVDLCTDCFFLCDCARVFNTGWVTADNKLYYSRRDIARFYARSWLVVDLGSSMPYGTVLKLLSHESSAPAWMTSGKKMVKMLRLLRLAKLLKLMRMSRIILRIRQPILEFTEEHNIDLAFFDVFRIGAMFFTVRPPGKAQCRAQPLLRRGDDGRSCVLRSGYADHS